MAEQPENATQQLPPAQEPGSNPSAPPEPIVDPEIARRQKMIVTALIVGGVIFIALIILIVFLLLQPGVPTEAIKNVFIIFLAVEMLIVGIAVVVLAVQVATLVNLLQNEVRPMLNSTNDTINNLRGTTEFLSENLVEPVIQLNGYLASLKRMLELMGLNKK
jgi:membrane protein implicated in regulation of membrane protease activity